MARRAGVRPRKRIEPLPAPPVTNPTAWVSAIAATSGVVDGDKGDVTASGGGLVWTINPGVVTLAKMQNRSANSLIGSIAGGVPEEIACTAAGRALLDDANAAAQRTTLGLVAVASSGSAADLTTGILPDARMPDLTGDVTTVEGAVATTIGAGVVSLGKMANMASSGLIGSTTGGAPVIVTVTAAGFALIDDANAAAQRTTLGLGTAAVAATGDFEAAGSIATHAALTTTHGISAFGASLVSTADASAARTVLALSLIAASGSATDLVAGTVPAARMPALTGDVTTAAGTVATTIANNAVTTAKILDANVTLAKMANLAAGQLIGRDASPGVPEVISVGLGLEFSGASGIRRSALTGNVTAPTGSNVTTIAAGVVSLAMMSNIATDRLIGRDTALTGVPEALTVGGGVEFTGSGGIQRSALTGDVTAAAGGAATTIANDAVTNAKAANMAASTVKARITGSTGDPEDATVAQIQTLLGGVFLGIRFLTSGTSYAKTTNTTKIYVEAVGGGGAGGGAVAGAGGGGGGGGGQAGSFGGRWYTGLGAGPFTYAIGAAGAAGAAGNNPGGNGGSTTFSDGTTTLTCPGGQGGAGSGGTTTAVPLCKSAGGLTGAAPTNATAVGFAGQPGETGTGTLIATVLAIGVNGNGGGGPFGAGGGYVSNAAGAAASGNGGGGSGAEADTATTRVGGVGTAGAIRIWEFS